MHMGPMRGLARGARQHHWAASKAQRGGCMYHAPERVGGYRDHAKGMGGKNESPVRGKKDATGLCL